MQIKITKGNVAEVKVKIQEALKAGLYIRDFNVQEGAPDMVDILRKILPHEVFSETPSNILKELKIFTLYM
jgi:hypothetical protein